MPSTLSNHHHVPSVNADYYSRLYRRHAQGAIVRSGASLFMWITAWVALLLGAIQSIHFTGVTISIIYLILMNPPTLWVLKKISDRHHIQFFSLLINGLEVLGYTAIIYFLGGIEAAYLTPIYASLIIYVGVVSRKNLTFIVASFCTGCFTLTVLLEYFGFLPSFATYNRSQLPFANQITHLIAVDAMLFVVAFVSLHTARILRQNKKLRERNKVLEQVNKVKSEFLANMSHELRTPLNHIIGFTELVVDKTFGDLTQQQEEYLTDVHRSSKHLLSLINDILDLSRVEAGKIELEKSLVNIKDILENSLIMIKEKALNHGIKITTHLDGIPESIHADERRLKQILYNLLSNAVKFTQENGRILLAAKPICNRDKQNKDLSISETNYLQISVEDSGIGLKRKDLEKIFDRFEQVESSYSRRFQGSGLGLSLAKSLVELHGGNIWAESEGEGRGAVFSFTLPLGNSV